MLKGSKSNCSLLQRKPKTDHFNKISWQDSCIWLTNCLVLWRERSLYCFTAGLFSVWFPTNNARFGGSFFQCNSQVSVRQPFKNVCTHCTVRQLGSKHAPNGFMLRNTSCSQCESLFKPTDPACLHDWQLLNKLIQKLAGTQSIQRPTFLPYTGRWQNLFIL